MNELVQGQKKEVRRNIEDEKKKKNFFLKNDKMKKKMGKTRQ